MALTVIKSPKDVHDVIAVRFFTFRASNTVRKLDQKALSWAQKRKLYWSFTDTGSIICILPDEYHDYLKLTNVVFESALIRDVFQNSLEIIRDAGWTSVKRKIKLTQDELHWMYDNAPEQWEWIIR